MNLRICLVLVFIGTMSFSWLTIASTKPHISKFFSRGYSIVYVSNNIDASGLDQSISDDLTVTYKGLYCDDCYRVPSQSFWPAINDKIVVGNQLQAPVAEIKRHFGLKRGSVCRMTQVLDLPGVGSVELIQQMAGTRFGNTMSFGVSAVNFGIAEKLFDDLLWHEIKVPHFDHKGQKIGEYAINYCQYRFGSFFSGKLRGRKSSFFEGMTVLRRVLWNLLLLYRLNVGVKVILESQTSAEGDYARLVANQKKFGEIAEEVEANIAKAYELLGIEVDATEQEIKKAFRTMSLQKHPDKKGFASNDDQKALHMARDILLGNGGANGYRDREIGNLISDEEMECLSRDPRVHKHTSQARIVEIYFRDIAPADLLNLSRTIEAEKKFQNFSKPFGIGILGALMYPFFSKPMLYPSVFYEVTYTKL